MIGTYGDAISLGGATDTVPSTGTVRSLRTRGGCELNLEQQLTSDLGLFARASISQATVEEVGFTEINPRRQPGSPWPGRRPDDTWAG
jgi:high affinity Mn2+ porin